MIEEMITQAQAYISQRYLPWSLAAIGLVVGFIFIRVVDHNLEQFFSKVAYDRTLEILCQRSVKWFLWVVLISVIAGSLGFNVSGFKACGASSRDVKRGPLLKLEDYLDGVQRQVEERRKKLEPRT